jgi:hypothetical protein
MPDTIMPTFNQPQQGIPALVPQQQYPTPYGVTQGGGTGGLVDRNKIINDAVQNSLNQQQQIERMQRDRQSYQQSEKEKQMAANAPNGGDTPDFAAGHGDFMDTVLHGLSSLGTGIKSIFGGGQPAPQGAIPAPPQQQGPPAPVPMQGPPAPVAVQPQMDGGVVSPPQGTVPQFMKPQPTVLAFAGGGAIPAGPQSSFGVRDGGTPGMRGFAQGGPIPGYEDGGTIDPNAGPNAGPQMDPAVAQAHLSHVIDQLHGDMHAHALGDDDQPNHSRAIPIPMVNPEEAKFEQGTGQTSFGKPAGPAVAVDPQAGAAGFPAPGPQDTPPAQGVPTPAQAQGPAPAAPSPAGPQGAAPQSPPDPAVAASAASVQAVQNAPPDDPAKTGVQTTSPGAEGKPHSITPDTWNKWDQGIDKAVYYAAIAGHDPGQVRAALEANRNAYIQGHVLRYLASANVALQNGDQKGVEAAMRNAYYYMPDGQDLTVQKGSNGQLMYQDPVNPTKLDGNNVAHPNMIPVDAAHLQLLGQAMLDPMQVNRTIMEVRSAQAVAGLKAAQSQAAVMTGEGNLAKGQGILATGQSHLQRVDSQNYKDLSEGDQARARALWLQTHVSNTIRQNKIDPQLIKGANDASQMFEDAAQGQKTTVTGDPLTNPNVGKTTRDPSKSSIPGATPADIVSGKALASDIFLGGGGTVTAARAAQLATLAHTAKRSSHTGPDGKPTPDFMTDPNTGDTHVWNKALKKWEAFRLPVTSANDAASGKLGASNEDLDDVTRSMLADNGSGGRGAIPSGPDYSNEPDMEDQKMVGDDQTPS